MRFPALDKNDESDVEDSTLWRCFARQLPFHRVPAVGCDDKKLGASGSRRRIPSGYQVSGHICDRLRQQALADVRHSHPKLACLTRVIYRRDMFRSIDTGISRENKRIY